MDAVDCLGCLRTWPFAALCGLFIHLCKFVSDDATKSDKNTLLRREVDRQRSRTVDTMNYKL